jgi:hypothetical protein
VSDNVKYQYTNEIHKQLGYLATWLPGGTMELGDYGTLDDHLYTRLGSLKDRGFKVRPAPRGTPLEIEYSSRESVTLTIQLRGQNKNLPNIPSGQAGIDLKFTRSGSCVVVLNDAVERTVANLFQLQNDVRSLYLRRPSDWPKGLTVVSSIVQASSASVIVADSTSSHYSVTTEADLKAGLADLANVSLGLAVTSASDVSTKVLAKKDLRPLFRAFRLKETWTGNVKVQTLAAAELPAEIGSPDSPFEWVSSPPPSGPDTQS